MARVARTRYSILGFLSWRPMSGYDIKKAVEQSTANFWKESYGQIYPILQQLADDGLARRTGAERIDGRERVLYAITARGRRALRRWLAEPTEIGTVRNEMLLKLFFGRQAPPSVHRTQIESLRQRTLADLDRLAGIRALLGDHTDVPDSPYWLMTLGFGETQLRAQLDWCNDSLAVLARMTAKPRRATPRTRRRTR